MLYKLNALPEWLWKKSHRHPIVRLLAEYIPPLDYMGSFGKELMQRLPKDIKHYTGKDVFAGSSNDY